jgi:hypothetical protein
MARKVDDIYQLMIDDMVNYPELNEAGSVSLTAIYKLIFKVCAFAIFLVESLFDLFKAETDAKIQNAIPGSIPWWADQARSFQLGDNLVWKDNKYQYAVIDSTKRIITQSAAVEAPGNVLLKVVKSTGKLDNSELTAFKTYVSKIRPAGVKVSVISWDPDKVKFGLKVWYNAMIIDKEGILLADMATKPIEVAINSYLTSLTFPGKINLTEVTDIIQAASGVNDIVVELAAAGRTTANTTITNNNYIFESGQGELETGQSYIKFYDENNNLVNTLVF